MSIQEVPRLNTFVLWKSVKLTTPAIYSVAEVIISLVYVSSFDCPTFKKETGFILTPGGHMVQKVGLWKREKHFIFNWLSIYSLLIKT